jgi:hypothetical protein
MLGPIWFRLQDSRLFQPMHVAPWAEEAGALGLDGLMSHLRGEWPCVPFGTNVVPPGLPAGWVSKIPDDDLFVHGFSAHNRWELCEAREGFVHLAIKYPKDSPVIALDRWICGNPDGPTISVKLGIHVRREIEVPVALHLTFRMPTRPGSLLVSAEIEQVISYPVRPEPEVSGLLPDGRSRMLRAVKAIRGNLDLSALPLSFATEELAQLINCQGAVHLKYLDENATITLNWDQDSLPDALLWLSNGGRLYPPWTGRHFALGIEPLAGPFDLGRVAIPPSDHPLANRLLKLTPDHLTTLTYSLTATAFR